MPDHFVIDGSNLATEGRNEPSFAQLQEAVGAFRAEHADALMTVVVDASFAHRIEAAERDAYHRAEASAELVSPPAGAVGRGDGFLLQIANRTDGTVVSNDSFQEFHGDYPWLFDPGRLIGGKPVPVVGWIFSLRRPVRGVVSRRSVQGPNRSAKAEQQVKRAIAEATADALQVPSGSSRRAGRSRRDHRGQRLEPPVEAVNEPAPFLRFVIDHALGTEVAGTVDAFASHGAFVLVDGVRCYVPLSAMGKPHPNRARDVLTRSEARTFVVQAVDAPRRGIELALPGFASVAGAPTQETVDAEVRGAKKPPSSKKAAATKKASPPAKRAAKRAANARPAGSHAPVATKAARTAKKAATKTTKTTEPVAKKTAKAPAKAPGANTSMKRPAKQAAASTRSTKKAATKPAKAPAASTRSRKKTATQATKKTTTATAKKHTG